MKRATHPPHIAFGVRLSPKERAWLETIARQDVRSGGEVFRWLLQREVEGRGMTSSPNDPVEERS
ncbi:MAG: hypothetical protein LLG93_10305 [Deltaproteobacteria bacterium]|nr:hypothetical protein [Deltaproteobacteria bacterium]